MSIHIRGSVEFEKILSEQWQPSIEMTRTRMAVQQLLDTRESPTNLEKRLKEYIVKTDTLIDHLAKQGCQTLTEHPIFEWSVEDAIIRTPCWRIESILPRYTLATLAVDQAFDQIQEHNYKGARNKFLHAVSLHTECAQHIARWPWKLPSLNQDVLQNKWHLSQIELYTGMSTLCMLCAGIHNNTKSSALFTVAQRSLRNFSRSLATWPSKQGQKLMNIAEAMRYFSSADMMWSAGLYGQSIRRLERWKTDVEFGPFELLKDEWAKLPLLLKERHIANNGAYFETLTDGAPLCSPVELINTSEASDIPHPPMTPEWGVGREDESIPTKLPENQ